METRESEARAIIEAVERHHKVETITLDGVVELLAVPRKEGVQIQDLKPFRDARRDAPERLKGTARATTLESFVELVKRSADADSALFVDDSPAAPKIVAILDYNLPARDGAHVDAMARFCHHRVEYAFPLSEEWQRWTGAHDKAMSQQGFAEFLEDRRADVVDPATVGDRARAWAAQLGFPLADPTQLVGLSKGLSVNVGANVRQAVNLSTGEVQVSFEESHATKDATGREVRVPGGFVIGIPIFRGGDLYEVPVRLRYRVSDGKVVWRVLLSRTDAIFADAITSAARAAEAGTGLPTYYGTPES